MHGITLTSLPPPSAATSSPALLARFGRGMAAMLVVVLADNLLLVFWEITSIASFLLIAYLLANAALHWQGGHGEKRREEIK